MGRAVKLNIEEKEAFHEAVARLIHSLHEESARLILLRSHQHISIHEMRKNIKKIRGILRLVRYEIGKDNYEALNAFYREIANTIAVLRDDTSQIELLKGMQLNLRSAEISRAIASAISQVKVRRKKEFARFYADDLHHNISKLLKNKLQDYGELTIVGDPDSFIFKGIKKVYRKARTAMEATEELNSRELYHDLRKQVKYLMYHLSIISHTLSPTFQRYVSDLNELSDHLGNLHDLDLFNAQVLNPELIKLKEPSREALLKHIYRRRSYLKRKIHRLGDSVFRFTDKEFSQHIYSNWITSRPQAELTGV